MDFSKLDFRIGKDFSSKVLETLGSQVSAHGKPAGQVFHLLVSFSRNRFRLTEDSVGICLQSILGGTAEDFDPFLLEDQIFRFAVASKQVGFMILELVSFSCEWFKLGFFLLNDGGFHKALAFAKSDSGPSYSWERSGFMKLHHSYAQAASSSSHPLTGANCIPLGPRERRHHSSIEKAKSSSVFDRLHFPRRSLFDRIQFQSSGNCKNNFESEKGQRATSAPGLGGPAFSRPDTVAGFHNYGAKVSSPNHLRSPGSNIFRCWFCNQTGVTTRPGKYRTIA
jgi:hypothetical protein